MREMPADMHTTVDGRYRIDHKLAVGGFGAVYQATDLALDRPVALKVLHPELASDADMVARFRREATTLAKLASPHTLRMYEVGTWGGTLYFVTELLRGASLQQVFRQTGRLPWRRVAEIAQGICSSLREAHALGIVHRDLKPANIFLEQLASGGQHVKVLDFGIAKIVEGSGGEELTRHGQMIGTFDYMAPEQMTGGRITAAVDVFTLGAVMHEMITGQRPFGMSANPAQRMMALFSNVPVPLAGVHGVPEELANMVMKCLSRDAVHRPTVEQIDAVLERVFEADEDDDARFGSDDAPTIMRPSSTKIPRVRFRAPSPVVLASAPRSAGIGMLETLPATPSPWTVMPSAPVVDVEPAQAPTRMPKATPHHGTFARGSTPELGPSVVQEHGPASAPQRDSSLVATVRFLTVAACLFGLGFVGALVLWSV